MREKQLEDIKYINSLLVQYENGKSYEAIRRIVAEEEEKRRVNEKWDRHPYYAEIKQYVEMGITDINQLALSVGKSYSTVRRALQDMGIYPLKAKNVDNMKLNI